ncbi:MAG: hypothetical protein ICV68_06800, partial [Pyrinomonadaceae bacterium]|nr:hypothetical protein [Pyrinomonadaceae bacterium]
MTLLFLQASTNALLNLSDLRLIAPEIILTICACAALVMEVVLPYKKSKWTAYFALISLALAFISLLVLFWGLGGTLRPNLQTPALPSVYGFYNMIRMDGFAFLFKTIFLL